MATTNDVTNDVSNDGAPTRPDAWAVRLLARPFVGSAWKIVGSLVAALLLVMGVFQVVVAVAHEENTLTQRFDAAGVTRVEVHNEAGGAVRVVGSDAAAEAITVTARISDGLRKTGHSERVEDGTLLLEVSCPMIGTDFCMVTYDVETPADVDVFIRGDRGRVAVSNIAGDVDVRNDNGGIELVGIDGSVSAHSDNGSVEATGLSATDVDASSDNGHVKLEFDDAPATVTVDSDNGLVEVVVPEGPESYAVDATTDNGAVTTSVSTDPASPRSITATSDNGAVTIRYG